jgi:hypothetical protein
MKFSYNQICLRNGLTHDKETLKTLSTHFVKHYTTPQMALTRSLVKENAVELYNTLVETNFSLKQVDILMADIFTKVMNTADEESYHKLMKNMSDMLKRKNEYLHFLYKVSGKSTADELEKASLVAMIKKSGEMAGEELVNKAREKHSGKTVHEMVFGENEHMAKIIEDINKKEAKKAKNQKFEEGYEVEDVE